LVKFEERIGTEWQDEQYLLKPHKNPEWLRVLVLAHLG